ncbi:MAG TPA: ADP-ribosylglycohydrolase family protein [Cyanobacteria bacterium UBA11369]|nr:ADP-ribosylglycohydrolase family protein [Cyanobacteria bacterium UBA8543]HAZ43767.1 ADP-ribosylglycohydrolase family protein [Cyanobacteria bacterium UBA11371]HBE30745.1 ADP-ribosylglycohydrolase family protein [Cyanobacteria bacterium UBA11368]HBE52460.1 ADP-ribosylglycohydrolase family protein [Cyanobacteria bacterium UBA11369]
MNSVVADKIRGVIFGQAIGDALGFGTEWIPKSQVKQEYPEGLRNYSQIVRYRNISGWIPGDWTDDTDQMLCILDSLLEQQQFDIKDIARRFHHWATTDGMGMGQTVYSVVHSPDFLQNPHLVAKQVWQASDGKAAANGGVMRTSVLGIWEYPFPAKVKYNASQVCQITHYDPRCVGSCVAVSLAIAAILRGETNIPSLIESIALAVQEYHPSMLEYFDKATTLCLKALDLDEGLNPGEIGGTGYTLKTMAAGFWALNRAESYEDGILQIIHEGGDADTNAAVAGALLGARFGYKNIPQQWVKELVYEQELNSRVEKLITLAQ